MVFKLIHYLSGRGDGSELEFFLLPLKVLFERFLHWLILAKLCMVLSCADVISCYFGTKASCNTAIPRILIIVLSTSRKAMGTVLKQTFILEKSTTWRSLNSQEPLFMRHYLMLVIWFLLFQAEICEPEIKENFISEAPECNIFEAKYFTQQLLQRRVNILLRAAPWYCCCWLQGLWSSKGVPGVFVPWASMLYKLLQSSPKLPAPSSQLSHGNTGIFRTAMSTSCRMLLL